MILSRPRAAGWTLRRVIFTIIPLFILGGGLGWFGLEVFCRLFVCAYPARPLTMCRSNLREIGVALDLYRWRFGRQKQYPPGKNIQWLNSLYTANSKPALEAVLPNRFDLLVCPMTGSVPPQSMPISETDCDYLFKAGGSSTTSALDGLTADEPIGIDKPGNHGDKAGEWDANVLFFDGHVETITNPAWISDYRRRILTPGPTKN